MDIGAASPSALAGLILSIAQTQVKEQKHQSKHSEQNMQRLNTTQETST
jgi:hypothetical protein